MTTEFVTSLEQLQLPSDRGSVVTVGTFDGIHAGHQEILRRVHAAASNYDLIPILVTFDPHPRVVVSPDDVPMLLTSIEEKKRFLPNFFDGQVLIMKFDAALREVTAEQFIREILVERLRVKQVIVGYDHAFGKNRGGTIVELERQAVEFGFGLEVVDPVVVGGKPVSSSRIREAISGGNLEEALSLLGHEYAIFGTVERGIGMGRKLGYPTANVAYSARKLLPREGIYACWAETGVEQLAGMMFIGQNHFNPVRKISVEANLFDFDRDIYDRDITVYPCRFVRESRKFDTPEKLAAQIDLDKKKVMEILSKGEAACQ